MKAHENETFFKELLFVQFVLASNCNENTNCETMYQRASVTFIALEQSYKLNCQYVEPVFQTNKEGVAIPETQSNHRV